MLKTYSHRPELNTNTKTHSVGKITVLVENKANSQHCRQALSLYSGKKQLLPHISCFSISASSELRTSCRKFFTMKLAGAKINDSNFYKAISKLDTKIGYFIKLSRIKTGQKGPFSLM